MKMMQLRKSLVLWGCVVGLQAAWAGPLQRSQIPEDAAWFLNLDVDGLKKTAVGRHILAELDKPEAAQKIQGFQAFFNFDPRKTLNGCTLYSRGSSPEDAVLVLHGQFDTERLNALAKMGKEYRGAEHRGYTIHSWIDEKKAGRGSGNPRSCGALHGSGAVILGQKPDRVGEALDVLDGVRKNLSGSSLLGQGSDRAQKAVVVGAARQAGLGQLPPNVAFLRNFKSLVLTAQEAQENLVADLVVEAENEDAARNLLAVGQGLLAWTAFQGDKAGANKLLQGLSTAQKDSYVTMSLKLPAADVVQLLSDLQARRGPGRPTKPR